MQQIDVRSLGTVTSIRGPKSKGNRRDGYIIRFDSGAELFIPAAAFPHTIMNHPKKD